MKTLLISALLTLLSLLGGKEPDYFYVDGKKYELNTRSDQLVIKFKTGSGKADQDSTIAAESIDLRTDAFTRDDVYLMSFRNKDDRDRATSRLKSISSITTVHPVYLTSAGPAYVTDEFVVQFKITVPRSDIDSLCKSLAVTVVQEPGVSPFWVFRLPDHSDINCPQMAAFFYETLPCEWAVPNWMIPSKVHSIPNDPYFSNQYYLHNTGQFGGTVDADIDAVEAWDVTTGSSSIVVAVIDQGISINGHEDLPRSSLITEDQVSGLDVKDGDNNPSPEKNNSHGMACAGIIAAQHNGVGIAGIAPSCKIMPIRATPDDRPYDYVEPI